MYKKINLLICILIITLLFCGCSNTNEQAGSDNEATFGFEKVVDDETEQSISNSENENDEHSINNDDEIKIEKYPRQYKINKSNIYEMNDAINTNDLQFSINSIKVCTELPDGITKDEVEYLSEKVDENGKVNDKRRYVFADINIKNNSDAEIIYYISNGFLIEMNTDGKIIDSSMEICYQSLFDETKQSIKDYYKLVLASQEEVKVNMGYIVNASLAESDRLYYAINVGNDQLSDDIKAFKITDVINDVK